MASPGSLVCFSLGVTSLFTSTSTYLLDEFQNWVIMNPRTLEKRKDREMFRSVKSGLRGVLLALSVGVLSGCGAYATSHVLGVLYSDVKGPVLAPSVGSSTKVGRASAQSILGLIALGDASIETAARGAGITKIHHVDYEVKNILGIVATYTVVVYGE